MMTTTPHWRRIPEILSHKRRVCLLPSIPPTSPFLHSAASLFWQTAQSVGHSNNNQTLLTDEINAHVPQPAHSTPVLYPPSHLFPSHCSTRTPTLTSMK